MIENLCLVFLEALGDFSAPNASETPYPFKRFNKWLVLLLLQVITNIVALNTLIALIGDSFEKVTNDIESYDALKKVDLLDEVNDMLIIKADKKAFKQLKKAERK